MNAVVPDIDAIVAAGAEADQRTNRLRELEEVVERGLETFVEVGEEAFTDLNAINQAHAVGIARDLNLADITTIQTAAGSVTAFDAANLDRNVR